MVICKLDRRENKFLELLGFKLIEDMKHDTHMISKQVDIMLSYY